MKLSTIILTIGLYLSLTRGTNINLFYPADSRNFGSIDYTLQTALNYLLLLLLVGFYFVRNNYRLLIEPLLNNKVLVIVALCLFSVVLSGDLKSTVKFTITVLVLSLFPYLYYKEFGRERLVMALARFVVAMCFINLAYTFALPHHGIMAGDHAGAWRGMFIHKNNAGPFFAIAFFCLLFRLQYPGYRNRLYHYMALAIALLFVALSKSTTAYVVFCMMFGLYLSLLLVLRSESRLTRIAFIVGVLSAGLFTVIFAGDLLAQIFFQLTGKDMTFTGRTGIWDGLIALSMERPFLGYGLGTAQDASFVQQIFLGLYFAAATTHNAYLDLVINIGYPGAILFSLWVLQRFFQILTRPFAGKEQILFAALACSILACLLVTALSVADIFIGRSILWQLMLISLLTGASSLSQRNASS